MHNKDLILHHFFHKEHIAKKYYIFRKTDEINGVRVMNIEQEIPLV